MKYLLILLLLPVGIFAQDSTSIKKRPYKYPTWDEKTQWQNRISAGIAGLTPDQTAMAPFKGQIYGDFKAYRGWTLGSSIIRNYRRNPISLVADLSVTHNQVNMTMYDTYTAWNVHLVYHFKNFNLADVGVGAEIEGRFIFADFQYRIGYLWGGKTNDTSQSQPEIVRNGKLNLNSNLIQGLQLGFGLRFKGFHIRANATSPFGRYQVQMYKDWECSVTFRSITAGYTWSLGQKDK